MIPLIDYTQFTYGTTMITRTSALTSRKQCETRSQCCLFAARLMGFAERCVQLTMHELPIQPSTRPQCQCPVVSGVQVMPTDVKTASRAPERGVRRIKRPVCVPYDCKLHRLTFQQTNCFQRHTQLDDGTNPELFYLGYPKVSISWKCQQSLP
jgi:hypothetical protein